MFLRNLNILQVHVMDISLIWEPVGRAFWCTYFILEIACNCLLLWFAILTVYYYFKNRKAIGTLRNILRKISASSDTGADTASLPVHSLFGHIFGGDSKESDKWHFPSSTTDSKLDKDILKDLLEGSEIFNNVAQEKEPSSGNSSEDESNREFKADTRVEEIEHKSETQANKKETTLKRPLELDDAKPPEDSTYSPISIDHKYIDKLANECMKKIQAGGLQKMTQNLFQHQPRRRMKPAHV